MRWFVLFSIFFICLCCSAQPIIIKGNPFTKSDESLVFMRYAPGDWQNSNRNISVFGIGYNFFEQSGFVPVLNVNGSAFYNQEWQKATIRLKNGQDLPNQDVIYLISYQIIFWKKENAKDGEKLFILGDDVNGVLFDQEDSKTGILPEFVPGYFEFENKLYQVYFELLSDGKASLLRYHRRKVELEYEYNNPAGKKSFIPVAEYYFLNTQGNWQFAYPATIKEQISTAWPALKIEIETWFQKNNYNPRKEKDLILFFNWLREQLQ